MKNKCSLEDRTITIPSELMNFAKNRVGSMIHINPYETGITSLAKAYLLACNDMTQIIPLIKDKS